MARTVLIVDDHAHFRAVARMLLQSEGFEVVGEAEDGGGALGAAAHLAPQLVLLDIQLPDMDGFEVARRLSRTRHPPPVILTSSRPESVYGHRVASSGALGFISKEGLSGAALDDILVGGDTDDARSNRR